ncbi:hypothetical protein GCM10007304_29630 [Rhodococcoides trifolii]|uniref:Uncharacterized protein n=1 Tax=Rhodococcoides trifolii TaxID=908250 RepID=A0A917D942_9NOCA|nr:hypothetical protein GCM10007304_29630 [Rhodococcus trifolii]
MAGDRFGHPDACGHLGKKAHRDEFRGADSEAAESKREHRASPTPGRDVRGGDNVALDNLGHDTFSIQ